MSVICRQYFLTNLMVWLYLTGHSLATLSVCNLQAVFHEKMYVYISIILYYLSVTCSSVSLVILHYLSVICSQCFLTTSFMTVISVPTSLFHWPCFAGSDSLQIY